MDRAWLRRGPEGGWEVPEEASSVRIVASRSAPGFIDLPSLTALAVWARRYAATGKRLIVDDSLKSPEMFRRGLLSALTGRMETPDPQGQAGPWRPLWIPDAAQIKPLLRRVEGSSLAGDAKDLLLYSLGELLRNVFEHSGSPVGASVCLAMDEVIECFVADAGQSIPQHMRRDTDEAISLKMALQPEVSGSLDRDRNAGLGLFVVSQHIKQLRGDFFCLSSGVVGEFLARDLGSRTPLSVSHTATCWPGTVVGFSVQASSVKYDLEMLQQILLSRLRPNAADRIRLRTLATPEEAPADAIFVEVGTDAGGFAEDKVRVAALREERVLPSLHAGRPVILDFSGVSLTTQSFVHALLAKPVREFRERAGELILLQRVRPQVLSVLSLVLSYLNDDDTLPGACSAFCLPKGFRNPGHPCGYCHKYVGLGPGAVQTPLPPPPSPSPVGRGRKQYKFLYFLEQVAQWF
jgi:hypothetical protein